MKPDKMDIVQAADALLVKLVLAQPCFSSAPYFDLEELHLQLPDSDELAEFASFIPIRIQHSDRGGENTVSIPTRPTLRRLELQLVMLVLQDPAAASEGQLCVTVSHQGSGLPSLTFYRSSCKRPGSRVATTPPPYRTFPSRQTCAATEP